MNHEMRHWLVVGIRLTGHTTQAGYRSIGRTHALERNRLHIMQSSEEEGHA